MIQALHDRGISVVMDVVYNHTYSTDSCFQYTVPNYYYRMKTTGAFSDGSVAATKVQQSVQCTDSMLLIHSSIG